MRAGERVSRRLTRIASPLAIAVLAAVMILPLPPRGVAAGPLPNRYAVILVLDGARPDDLSLAPMPNLHALMDRGVTYTQAFVGQELANTPPSHATIGTGMLPKHHGVQGFLWEDPHTHTVINPTSTTAVVNGTLEQVIADHHVPSLAARIKAVRPAAHVASVSGHKCYASDAMGTPSADYILCALIYHDRWVAQAVGTHRPPPGAINNPAWDVPIPSPRSGFGPAVEQWQVGTENAWTVRYALWAFHRVHYPRVLMINLPETDVLGHFASSTDATRRVMQGFDDLFGQIVDAYHQAGILDRTDFVVVADHGMSQIRAYVPYSVLSNAAREAGATTVYIEHDTAGAIGIKEQSKARAVAQNVMRLGGTRIDATYYKTLRHGRWTYLPAAVQPGLPARLQRAYRRLANTMASDAGPNVFAVFAPHISTRKWVINGYAWTNGHLGPQWDDQHIPLILAGPGIKSGIRSSYPARLVDIAPTIEHLLGAQSSGTDGVVLQDALSRPSAGLEEVQQGRRAQLTPVVRVLEWRSGHGR